MYSASAYQEKWPGHEKFNKAAREAREIVLMGTRKLAFKNINIRDATEFGLYTYFSLTLAVLGPCFLIIGMFNCFPNFINHEIEILNADRLDLTPTPPPCFFVHVDK